MASVKVELELFPEKNLKKRKCLIEDVIMKNKAKVEPLFMEFANGRPLDDSSLTATLHQDVSDEPQRKSRRVITVPTDNLAYAGMNFGQGVKRGNTTTFIGVRDRNTGRMRLIETSSFTVRPVIDMNLKVAKPSNPDTNADNANANLTYLEKQVAVMSAFGTRKAKNAVRRKMLYQVDSENMTSAIDQAAKSARVKTVEELQKEEEARLDPMVDLLPPRNTKAAEVKDVYRLKDLVHSFLLRLLKNDAMKFLGDDLNTESYSQLVKELLVTTKMDTDEDRQVKHCSVALYIHHLQSFLRCPEKLVKVGKRLPKCPAAVSNFIYKNYSSGKVPKKFVTSIQKDKVLTLILILSFVVNEFELSVETLLMSLSVEKPRLDVMMKIIGATYQAASMKYVLRLPLAKYRPSQKARDRGSDHKKKKGKM